MGWLGVRLKQVLTRVRASGCRCHSDVITVRDDTGWQGAGDVTHRKHAEVCVRIPLRAPKLILLVRRPKFDSYFLQRVEIWTPNEKDQFWSLQARGELGPLELRAKWIRQHRRLCLFSLRRNLNITFLWMKTCNLLVVRANNIRRLEFWFETLEISLIDGIAGRISHICS